MIKNRYFSYNDRLHKWQITRTPGTGAECVYTLDTYGRGYVIGTNENIYWLNKNELIIR